MTNRTTPETITLLKEGKIDIGLVNLPITDNKMNIQETSIIEDCFIAGLKYKHLAETPISLEKLLTYPIILLEKGSSTRAYIDGFAESQGITMIPEIELGSMDLLVDFARDGFGVACVIKDFISQELSGGTIYEIQLENPFPPRSIGIVTLKGTPLSAAAKHLFEILQK